MTSSQAKNKTGRKVLDDAILGGVLAKRIGVTAAPTLYVELEKKLTALGFDVTANTDDEDLLACIIDAEVDTDLQLTKQCAAKGPVVLLSNEKKFEFKIAAARAGAVAVLNLPLDTVELSAWLKDFDDVGREPHSIVIVDDDELTSMAYALALENAGMRVKLVSDPLEAVDAVNNSSPDLVLMDLHMPGASGIEIAQVLRQSRQNLSLPIMFLSAERDVEQQQEARRIGGDDFIQKPVDLDELVHAVSLRADRAKALRDVMERDSLTGLLNHARFKERLTIEIERSQRSGAPMSVSIIDLDHFKQVNDVYGHQAGDRVIQTLAHFITGSLRRTDVVARYGGEEFAVILLDTEPKDAEIVLNKMRSAFFAIGFEADGGEHHVSLSAGVAGAADFCSADSVLLAADDALYAAKHAGRNRVNLAASPLKSTAVGA